MSALLDPLLSASLATAVPLDRVVLLAAVLFSIGLAGVTSRRNVLIVLLSVEIMLNAANVVLVGFSRVHSELSGQVFVFFSMTVAAAEVAVGLAIVIALFRLRKSTDVDDATELAEVDYGPVPPLKLEGENQHHDDHHDDHHGDASDGDDEGGDGDGDKPAGSSDPDQSAAPVGTAGEA